MLKFSQVVAVFNQPLYIVLVAFGPVLQSVSYQINLIYPMKSFDLQWASLSFNKFSVSELLQRAHSELCKQAISEILMSSLKKDKT